MQIVTFCAVVILLTNAGAIVFISLSGKFTRIIPGLADFVTLWSKYVAKPIPLFNFS